MQKMYRYFGRCINCPNIISSVHRVCGECKMVRRTFYSMQQRCGNPNHPSYPLYGGRGIRVCQLWLDDRRAFILYCRNILGDRPDGYSIDRINNDGDYEPGNVRWASPSQQAANTCRARGTYMPDIPVTEKVRIGGYKSMRKREQETEKAFRRLRDQGEIPL